MKTGEASSSKVKSRLTSIDLSWDEEGNWANMLEDEDPFIAQHWRFQRDYFKEIPYHTIELTHYEAVVQKVGRHLYPQETERMEPIELSAPLIKMKIKAQWEDWEASHPEMGRAGCSANPKKLNSREIMEGQLEWRKEWFRQVPSSLKIYAQSPQEMRIDPSFCPCERRYSWEEFSKLQERQPYIQNFPFIHGPSMDEEFDKKWFVK